VRPRLLPTLRPQDHQRAADERERDRHRMEEHRLDVLAEQEPECGSRDERDDEIPRETPRRRVAPEAGDRVPKRARYSQTTAIIAPDWMAISNTFALSPT